MSHLQSFYQKNYTPLKHIYMYIYIYIYIYIYYIYINVYISWKCKTHELKNIYFHIKLHNKLALQT